jgi:CO/xanthine dehydrogenase Mo-binding subunit
MSEPRDSDANGRPDAGSSPRPESDVDRRAVGRSARRTDARAKVRGEARYPTDLEPPDVLHAGVLRSQQPHARLTEVRTGEAAAMDDVAAVVAREDLPGGFDDRVRHYGDAVVAVAAETREAVEAALSAIEYDTEPLASVHDPRESVGADAPLIHDDPAFGQPERHPRRVENPAYEQNVADYHRRTVGDVEAGLQEADHVHEATYRTPRVNHCNLDRHCCLAEWEGDTLRLTETVGSPPSAERKLEALFDDCEVAVEHPPHAGSSFGGRSLPKLTLEPVAAKLARETGRPVRLAFDREEEFTAAESRHATYVELTAGATEEGDLTTLTVDVVADTGAYPNGVGHIVLSAFEHRPLDVYRLANYRYEGVASYTNNPPAGEYRGIGVTQLTWALDSHLDELARQAGFDPVAFRRDNWVAEGHERPHTGAPVTSCGLRECLERGRETFAELRSGQDDDHPTHTDDDHPTHTDDAVVTGWGVGVGGQSTTPASKHNVDHTEARVVLSPDGELVVRTGGIDVGQGAETALAQIAAEASGVPMERIRIEGYAHDDGVDDKYGSVANRTTYLMGRAVAEAAAELAGELCDRAAAELDAAAADLAVATGRVEGPDGRSVPAADLLEEPVETTSRVETDSGPIGYGVHFAEVQVDTGTGATDVTAYVAAQDVGFAINPTLVECQLEGAVEHGVEFATLSEVELTSGIPANANLADYPVSSPHEMPDRLACEIVESEEASGPFGAKGVGTPSMPPVAPAITNAIRDAVGERFTETPVRDEDVFLALRGEDR